MLIDDKRQALYRALIGAVIGVALHVLLGYLLGCFNLLGSAHFSGFRFPDCNLYRFFGLGRIWDLVGIALSFALWALFGAEVGVATLPFADSGRALVVRSLVHYVITSATVGLWAGLNFGAIELSFFLIPLALVYALVWLGRWVGWFAEVAAIRAKLGLAPGPSLFHWRESLPYAGFAALLCLVLPTVLRLVDAVDVPVLSVFYVWLLLPVGGFMSGLSLGRRHGFCPLYPCACVLFTVVFLLTARLYSNMADGALIPIAAASVVLGNAFGAFQHNLKQKASDGI